MNIGALAVLILVLIILIWIACGLSQSLQTTHYTLYYPNLPSSFDGYKIVQLSDLHGVSHPDLPEKIARENPDLICCTGDIFDGKNGADISWKLMMDIKNISPVCYVSGNHENYRPDWPEWRMKLEEQDIRVLEDEEMLVYRNGDSLWIAGLDDPGKDGLKYPALLDHLEKNVRKLPKKKGFRILLFHRASLFEELPDGIADLILSGHLHGGQWRIFGQGIAAPGNGRRVELFPEFDAGEFKRPNCRLIVSRGLGDRMKIPRFCNNPEIVSLTLKKGDKADTIN